MTDFLIAEAESLLVASKNRAYQERAKQTFDILIRYLQQHGLTTRTLLGPGETTDITTKIMASDLTPRGLALIKVCFDKWLKGHDRGKEIGDMSLFDKELQKQ